MVVVVSCTGHIRRRGWVLRLGRGSSCVVMRRIAFNLGFALLLDMGAVVAVMGFLILDHVVMHVVGEWSDPFVHGLSDRILLGLTEAHWSPREDDAWVAVVIGLILANA